MLIGLVVLFVIVGVVLWLVRSVFPGMTGGSDAPVVVCQTKEGFKRVDPLDDDVTYTVETSEGSNTVVIADKTVDVTWADCSNQVCVEHDPITDIGEQIVCLPHGMVIEIVAHEEDAAALM